MMINPMTTCIYSICPAHSSLIPFISTCDHVLLTTDDAQPCVQHRRTLTTRCHPKSAVFCLPTLQVWFRPAHLQGLRWVPGRLSVHTVYARHRHRRLPASAPHRRQRRELQSVTLPPAGHPRRSQCRNQAMQECRVRMDYRTLVHRVKAYTVMLSESSQCHQPTTCFFVLFCLRLIISYVSCQVDDFCCFPMCFVPCGLLSRSSERSMNSWMFRLMGQTVHNRGHWS